MARWLGPGFWVVHCRPTMLARVASAAVPGVWRAVASVVRAIFLRNAVKIHIRHNALSVSQARCTHTCHTPSWSMLTAYNHVPGARCRENFRPHTPERRTWWRLALPDSNQVHKHCQGGHESGIRTDHAGSCRKHGSGSLSSCRGKVFKIPFLIII